MALGEGLKGNGGWPNDLTGTVINATDYGAAFDGVTDDTVPLQKAITAALTSGAHTSVLDLPAGTAMITANALVPAPGAYGAFSNAAGKTIIFRGKGMQSTVLKAGQRFQFGGLIQSSGGASNPALAQCVFEDLTLDGNYAGVGGGLVAYNSGIPQGAIVNLCRPGNTQLLDTPNSKYHYFNRVRFYRSSGYTFQPTRGIQLTDCEFDSVGQPDQAPGTTHFDCLGSGAGDAIVKGCTWHDSSGNYADFSSGLGLPTGLAVATAPTGGTLADGTYGYRVSSSRNDQPGTETLACAEVTIVATGGGTSKNTLTWVAPTTNEGANHYNVYGRTPSGELLLATVTGLTFVDDGSLTPAGALPVVDTAISLTKLIMVGNTSRNHQIGGIYACGSGSLIANNDLENTVAGSGVGYDGTTPPKNRFNNIVVNNIFKNLTINTSALSGPTYGDIFAMNVAVDSGNGATFFDMVQAFAGIGFGAASTGLPTGTRCSITTDGTALLLSPYGSGAEIKFRPDGWVSGATTANEVKVKTATGLTISNSGGVIVTSFANDGHAVIGGSLSVAQSATAAAVATSGTIATANIGVARVSPAGAVTAVILAAGTIAGQEVTVVNEAAAINSVTFDVAGTSNVADGVSSVIPGLRASRFIWDTGTSRWYRAA